MTEGILPGYDFPHEYAAPLGTDRATGQRVQFHTGMLNRHGTVMGATGTGKSRTLQQIAEWCSERGIPMLLNDAKGDMSGLCVPGELTEKQWERANAIHQYWWEPTSIPTEFIALGGKGDGVPARITVGSLGWRSLAKLVGLTPAQTTGLATAWQSVDNDSTKPTETISDLMALVNGMRDDPDIQLGEAIAGRINDRLGIFDRENPGLFGGPEFDIMDLIRCTPSDIDDDGIEQGNYGYVSIIDSSKLVDTPEILTTFMVWVLDQLVKHLPEVGDDEMKLVVAIDEAHLIFEDASKEFVRQFTKNIKRLRSKGVGILLCSQQLSDIPEAVLSQCGLRIQHTVRVMTPKQQRALRATVDTFPISKRYNVEKELTSMPIGTALVCIVDDNGMMTEPSVCQMYIPRTSMDPISEDSIREIVASSDLTRKYRRMEFEREERRRRGYSAPVPMMREGGSVVIDGTALLGALSGLESVPLDDESDYGMTDEDMAAVESHVRNIDRTGANNGTIQSNRNSAVNPSGGWGI